MSENLKYQYVTFVSDGKQVGSGSIYKDDGLIIRQSEGIKDGMEITVLGEQGEILAIGILADSGVFGGARLKPIKTDRE